MPWALSNVLSGSPITFESFVELSRYVAEYKNYWWQHVRAAKTDTGIQQPSASSYPSGRDEISDVPASDSGRNFGRIARTGLMDDYVRQFEATVLSGVKVSRECFPMISSDLESIE